MIKYEIIESQKGIAHSSSDCWLNEAYSVCLSIFKLTVEFLI